jgi:hypothetical protein
MHGEFELFDPITGLIAWLFKVNIFKDTASISIVRNQFKTWDTSHTEVDRGSDHGFWLHYTPFMNRLTSGWFPIVMCSESVKMVAFEMDDFAVFIAEYLQFLYIKKKLR